MSLIRRVATHHKASIARQITGTLLLVGAGGGGGYDHVGSGAGAGEVVYLTDYEVELKALPVVIGAKGLAGGAEAGTSQVGVGYPGGKSSFNGLEANGGGGGTHGNTGYPGGAGGSGAGGLPGAPGAASVKTAGGMGNPGGNNVGGGGGATGPGQNGNDNLNPGALGGPGFACDIDGVMRTYGVGGQAGANGTLHQGDDATPNTGNGGAGAAGQQQLRGGHGGSGVMKWRYPGPALWTGGVVSTIGGDTLHILNASDTLTPI